MKAYKTLILLCMVILLASCMKDAVQEPVHPFVGTYNGIMNTTSWNMMSGSTSPSTQQYIEATQDGDTVEVFGVRMHEDSLVENKSYYNGSGSNFLSFEFRNDSLFMTSNYGGLGGGTNSNYAGGKIN